MRKFKNIFAALAILIAACLFMTACGSTVDLTPKPPRLVNVDSVEVTNTETVLTPGEYTLTGKAKPSIAKQGVSFSVAGAFKGVSVDGDVLTIGKNAEDGEVISIKAASTYDPAIFTIREFTLDIPEIKGIEIRTEEELRAIDASKESRAEAYILMNDIVLTAPWEPIGVSEFEDEKGNIIREADPFMGIFDGNGYTVSGIDINRKGLPEQESKVMGFFEQIGGTGEVKRTKFQGKIIVNSWSGGITAINRGTISNCISDLEISAGNAIGAICSVNEGRVEYTYAIGKMESATSIMSARSAGLFVTVGDASSCFGDGQKMGNYNYHTLSGASTDPSVVMDTEFMHQADTFSAFDPNIWYIANGDYPKLKSPTYQGEEDKPFVSFTNRDKAIDMYSEDSYQLTVSISGVEDKTATFSIPQAVTGVTIDAATGVVSFDKNLVEDYSSLTVACSLAESPTTVATKEFKLYNDDFATSKVFSVDSEEKLYRIATEDRLLTGSGTIKLTADIALDEYKEWPGIGTLNKPFLGTFDGQGYTISGLDINASAAYGFFGCIGNASVRSTVKRLKLTGRIGGSVSWGGALVGNFINGVVENCITDVDFRSGESGLKIGAIVGNKLETVGKYAEVKNSVAVGKMATGNNTNTAGGISAGALNAITNCYVDSESTGTTLAVGAGGTTGTTFGNTVKMKTAATYSALDANVWHKVDGSYPVLKNEDNKDTPPVGKPVISVSNNTKVIDVYTNQSGFQVTLQTINVSLEEYTFSLAEEVTGVSIDADTGLITFDEVEIGTAITVKVVLNADTTVMALKKFTIQSSEPVRISTEAELMAIKTNPGGAYVLKNDIVLVDNANWKSFDFTGTFDGMGHTISGFNSSDGLFNTITGASKATVVVKNLRIEGTMSFGASWKGGIVNKLNKGTIENCIVDVNFSVTAQFAVGAIAGFIGDVGNNEVLVKNCLVLGTFAAVPNNTTGWIKVIGGVSANCDGEGWDEARVTNVLYHTATHNGANQGLSSWKRTEAQLKQASTFSSWSSASWNIVDGQIPTLKVLN